MKIAAFTMVHNEAQLLPVWLSYYQRYFDSLYVLDDRSTDDTIKKCKKKYKFEVVPLSQHDFSYLEWRVMTVREQQSKLLSEYDWVLFSDTDEIVIPDPQKFKGLRDYISQLKKDFVSCTGRVVVHLPEEAPMNFSAPILPQRKKWLDDIASYKPLLSRVPLRWTKGFHSLEEIDSGINHDERKKLSDPNLILVHLLRIDLDLYKKRSRDRRGKHFFYDNIKKAVNIPKRFKKVI